MNNKEKALEILEGMGLFSRPFKLTEGMVLFSDSFFSIKDLKKLLEFAYADLDDMSISEARAMKVHLRAIKASASGRGNSRDIRKRMLKALAQKGFLVHDRYYAGGNKRLIKAWERFKQKGKNASSKQIRKVIQKGPPEEIRAEFRKALKKRVKR